ncbi:1235_t:CDS:2, partial [Dentiscutata erythropus]
ESELKESRVYAFIHRICGAQESTYPNRDTNHPVLNSVQDIFLK